MYSARVQRDVTSATSRVEPSAVRLSARGPVIALRRVHSSRRSKITGVAWPCRPSARKHARVFPTTDMKLVSPVQRAPGTCRWSAMPAPAERPRLMPTLMPAAGGSVSAASASRRERHQLCQFVCRRQRQRRDMTPWHHHEVSVVIRVEIEDDVTELTAHEDEVVVLRVAGGVVR